MKAALLLALLLGVASLRADDSTSKSRVTPYPASLKTCVVSGDKLGGDMGKPYVFTYQGQEVKLCCKSCLKDFKKDPDKYMRAIKAAEKK